MDLMCVCLRVYVPKNVPNRNRWAQLSNGRSVPYLRLQHLEPIDHDARRPASSGTSLAALATAGRPTSAMMKRSPSGCRSYPRYSATHSPRESRTRTPEVRRLSTPSFPVLMSASVVPKTGSNSTRRLRGEGLPERSALQRIGTTGLVDTRLFAHVHGEVGELRFHCREGPLCIPLPLRKLRRLFRGER